MKVCPNCRTYADDGARFCMNCGADLSGAAVPKSAAAPKAKKKGGWGWLLILLAAVMLISYKNDKEKELKDNQSALPVSDSDLGSLWGSLNTDTTPAAETSVPTQGGLSYADDRVPHYVASDPQWETVRFDWERQDKLGTLWMNLVIDANMYAHYRSLARYQGVENYYKYINDANNRALIADIVRIFREVGGDISYTDADLVRECANFVQETITYKLDIDSTGSAEYPKYPIETLYEREGDCEDTSILMAALLKELGYEVGFLHLPGHVAVAIRTTDDYSAGMYYEINGHRYLYIESTATGWNIGDIPEDLQNVSATFYKIP